MRITQVFSVFISGLDDGLTHFHENLKNHFQSNAFAFIQPISFYPVRYKIDELYVNLTLEEISGYRKKEVFQDYKSLLPSAFASGLPVVVVGEPGLGKSTLLRRICYEWSLGNLPQYDLVLPAQLRDIHTPQELIIQLPFHWLMNHLPQGDKAAIAKAEQLLLQGKLRSRKLLVLLDGLDESSAKCAELERLVEQEGNNLGYDLLVTTRPMKGVKTGNWKQVTIEGLWEKQQYEFIMKFYGTSLRRDALLKFLRQKPSIQKMAERPLFLSFICVLGEEDLENFHNVTDLYVLVCAALIRHNAVKRHDCSLEFAEDWMEQPTILALGHMAFCALISEDSKVVFSHKELVAYGVQEHLCCAFGFLLKAQRGSLLCPVTEFYFLHKTLQEFFAALYLAKSDEINRLKDVKWCNTGNRKYQWIEEILPFAVGLSSSERCLDIIRALHHSVILPSILAGRAQMRLKLRRPNFRWSGMERCGEGLFHSAELAMLEATIRAAIKNGHTSVVNYLLQECCGGVYQVWGHSPVHYVAGCGDVDLLKYMAEDANVSVDLNGFCTLPETLKGISKPDKANTPLMLAAEAGHLPVVKYLIERGKVDVNLTDCSHYSALTLAARNDHLDVVQYLVDRAKADVTVVDIEGDSILHQAVHHGNPYTIAVVQFISGLSSVNINAQNNRGWAALDYDVEACSAWYSDKPSSMELPPVGSYLQSIGATMGPDTRLRMAADCGNLDEVKLIVKQGEADVNSANYYNNRAVWWAARKGHLDVVKYLVEEAAADVTGIGPGSWSIFHCAIASGNLALVKYLSEQTACDVNELTNKDCFSFDRNLTNDPALLRILLNTNPKHKKEEHKRPSV